MIMVIPEGKMLHEIREETEKGELDKEEFTSGSNYPNVLTRRNL